MCLPSVMIKWPTTPLVGPHEFSTFHLRGLPSLSRSTAQSVMAWLEAEAKVRMRSAFVMGNVENSWGPTNGVGGHLIMTDGWFDEYTFRLVVDKKYVPAATLRLLEQKPTLLPAWDPLFKGEE